MTEVAHPNPRVPGRIAAGILAAACFVLLFLSYRSTGDDLFAAWQTDEYSHGMIIPFISLLIAWHRLTETRPPIQPSWLGASVLAISGGVLLVGVLAAFQAAMFYALILSLTGLSLAFLGKAATRTIAPALVYLFFAIPLPHLFYSSLSQDLQLVSSTIGVFILDLLNIPVFQDGNIIDLGQYKLQVAEACSGLRYLFPLISFGYLVAYLLEDRLWKRIVVFLSAIPITIGMNSLRIAVIGITVNLWGIKMAEGFIHQFEGWVVFLLCVALLMGEVWALLQIGTTGRFRFDVFAPAHGAMFSNHLRVASPVIGVCALSAVLAAIFGTGIIDERPSILPSHPAFASFPTALATWHGQQHNLDPDVLKGLQLSDYWLADYTSGSEKAPVNFYIAYYASQRIGSSTHSPSNCIPGGGWQIVSKAEKNILLPHAESLTVSRLLIRKGDISQLVYFWFDERGRDITETPYAKWYLLVDSITMHRTDGALIRLVTQITKDEKEQDAENRLNNFLFLTYPVIKTFVPRNSLPTS